MDVDVRREDGIGVLAVDGYINNTGGEQLAEAFEGLLAEGANTFLINLAKCSIVNSVGISFLIEVLEKVKEGGGRVGFCCVSSTIAKTFRIMGLLQAAELFGGEQDALQALT